jgi:hypothetical protein
MPIYSKLINKIIAYLIKTLSSRYRLLEALPHKPSTIIRLKSRAHNIVVVAAPSLQIGIIKPLLI